MHRGLEEVPFGVFEGLLVVRSGMTVFGTGEVETHDRQAEMVARLDHRPRERERGNPVNLLARPFVEHTQKLGEVGGKAARKHPHGAGDDAVTEGRLAPLAHAGRRFVFPPGTVETAVHRGDHPADVETVAHVQLRREAHFDVAHPFGQIVFGQLVSRPFERFGVGQDGAGVGESMQVVRQIPVLLLEDQLEQTLGSFRGQLDLALPGQLDQRGQPQRAVEVQVQVGLGDGIEEFTGVGERHRVSYSA